MLDETDEPFMTHRIEKGPDIAIQNVVHFRAGDPECKCIQRIVLAASFEVFEAEFFEKMRPTSLIKRFAAPEEVASLVAYVASPLASAIKGAALRCRMLRMTHCL